MIDVQVEITLSTIGRNDDTVVDFGHMVVDFGNDNQQVGTAKKKKDSFYKRIGSIGLTLKKLYITLKSYICSRTNKTRNLVPQPEDYNIFGYRSIFNAKGDENGSVRRFKVRLTEQG